MTLLQEIQSNYDFKEATWQIEGELLSTDRGLKRVVKWAHEDVAAWHLHWRDELYKRTNILTDRMLQTIKGDRIYRLADGWITLHDEVTSLFSYQHFEKKMGEFLGKYYSMNMEVGSPDLSIKEYSISTFPQSSIKKLEYMKEEKVDPLIQSLRREALIRISKAEKLNEKQEKLPLPIICPIRSLDQGKVINENFFWQHDHDGNLEKGFRSLKKLFSQWLQKFGKKSLFSLLTEMDKFFSVKKMYTVPLLMECLLPWEFIAYMEEFHQAETDAEEGALKEELISQWENNRVLLKALYEWLNVTEERVKL